jgi:alkylhydroperoxidase family enzyme
MDTKPGVFRNVSEAIAVAATWLVASAFCVAFWVMVAKLLLAAFGGGKAEW